MYYKITNKECEKYKTLRAFREKELAINKSNKEEIKQIVGIPFESFVGHSGQESFDRVTRYSGFKFTDTTHINPRAWKTDREFPGAYFPNRRYKEGKTIAKQISVLPSSSLFTFMELLEMDITGRFSFPYLFIAGDTLLFFFDEKFEPSDPNFIEITKKEFEETREQFPEYK